MSLIIGKKGIPMLKTGYPTMSDKYNVAGGTLTGASPVLFGQLVKYSSSNPGFYEAITSAVTIGDIAGFVLATNVKLLDWNESEVYTKPGEAFNLLVNGFMAIELKDATEDQIKANSAVCVKLADGTLTTSDKKDSSTIVELPNTVFTGIYEKHGDKLIAEIYVK